MQERFPVSVAFGVKIEANVFLQLRKKNEICGDSRALSLTTRVVQLTFIAHHHQGFVCSFSSFVPQFARRVSLETLQIYEASSTSSSSSVHPPILALEQIPRLLTVEPARSRFFYFRRSNFNLFESGKEQEKDLRNPLRIDNINYPILSHFSIDLRDRPSDILRHAPKLTSINP